MPLIVILLDAQFAVTPAGRPVGAPIPVATVVVCVIAVSAVLIHRVGVADAADTVVFGLTLMVPAALTMPQPPVSGMV